MSELHVSEGRGTSDGRKISEAALNERGRPAVKMVLGETTITAAAEECVLAVRTD